MSKRLGRQGPSIIHQQAQKVLSNDNYALIAAVLCAMLPYFGWLAEVIVALVTLRKGAKPGGKLLMPVMLVHVLAMVLSTSLTMAVTLAVLNTLPTYIAAYVLRQTTSLRAVAAVLFALIVLGAMSLQLLAPEFANQQYAHLEAVLHNLAASQVNALEFWHKQDVSSGVLANYLLGVQGASFAFSALMPLFVARSIQSQLFYPGGFRAEMLHFRGDKISIGVLALLGVAAYFGQYLAMNALPLALLYFILAGLSFGAYVLSNMRPLVIMALLVLPLILLSWVMLPFYVCLGALDSVFNFRALLSAKAGRVT